MGKDLTERQFKLASAKLEERLHLFISSGPAGKPFDDVSPAACQARKDRCRNDQLEFGRTYLPHYFTVPSPPFHKTIHELCNVEKRLVVLCLFRGSAKTVNASVLDVLMDICYEREPFVILGSETEDQAADHLTEIRLEIEENERLRADFGELKGSPWKDTDITTRNGVRVKARGVGQKVRGLLHRARRPTKLIIDDIEDDESAAQPKQTKKRINWILSKALPGLDITHWKARVLGNLFHSRGVIATLMNDKTEDDKPRYLSLKVNALDEAGRPTWPERFSVSDLNAIRVAIGTVRFNKEYQNKPTDPGGLFQEEWFLACQYNRVDINHDQLQVVAAIDPALGMETSDYSAVIVLGFQESTGWYYVLDASIKKSRPRLTAEICRSYSEIFRFVGIGVETVAFQELMAEHVADLLSHIPVIKIDHYEVVTSKDGKKKRIKRSKEGRISELSFPVEMGKLKFDRRVGDSTLLVDQLLYYGQDGVHDDGPDALQMAYELIGRQRRGIGHYESVRKRESVKALEGYCG